ncbi:MAG: dTDP-4-dehydrorhamnose reductase family protein [Hyphomicrobiaceae bacterium]
MVIGGDGMLGHELVRALSGKYEIGATFRRPLEAYAGTLMPKPAKAFGEVDVRDEHAVSRALTAYRPDVVLNAAGVVKQRSGVSADLEMAVNARFPHQLAARCERIEAYLIHYSTDCVFSGRRGMYVEADAPDPVDSYGSSKLLGEVTAEGCLTLRTSMVGFELFRKTGLLEWFLSQNEPVSGWRRAVFSGITTPEQARVVARILDRQPRLSGLYHVSSEPISKYELLSMIKRHFELDVRIVPDDTVIIDRSLDSGRFRAEFGYAPPAWEQMVAELAQRLKRR